MPADTSRPMEECFHCHAIVLPMTGRSCPRCRKRMDDLVGATPHLRRHDVEPNEQLPAFCVSCGAATTRREELGSTRVMGSESFFAKVLVVLSAVMMPMKTLAHAATGPVQPHHVDFVAQRVTLLVHERFVKAMRQRST